MEYSNDVGLGRIDTKSDSLQEVGIPKYEIIEVLVLSQNPIATSQAQDIVLSDSHLSAYRHLGAAAGAEMVKGQK